MKFRPFLVPALLLTASGGLLSWLMLAEPPQVQTVAGGTGGPVSVTPTRTEQTERAPVSLPSTADSQAASAAPNPTDIRDVSPEGVTAPSVSGKLTRVEPSKRYLELKNPTIEPIPDGPLELRRVQVIDGGHIKSARMVVTLAHITPLKLDETCVSRLGGTWPCGTRARTFLRGLIRQFKITCEKIDDLGPQQILASCQRGKVDLSARLVRYGWADPKDDAPDHFQELALLAKERKVGKWQAEWLNDLPPSNWSLSEEATLPGLEELAPEIVEWSLSGDLEQRGTQDLPVQNEDLFPAPQQ
ncbi:MAG: thermonuclease family protein [Roseibium sp.]|uniref:thermonuclease family protein n=1 Tax=Roseibium sp. TaxID=1936156 RepID=UPI001B15F88D|nr:thermonuclease family protein [Roseibium sp.]MBO6890850.1 thermonuclease family protein [Roseibium sp.]MBO6932774.1 thermonuclease family protein [Roseibium sp.]